MDRLPLEWLTLDRLPLEWLPLDRLLRGVMPDLVRRPGLVPDLTRRFCVVPHLLGRLGTRRLGPGLALRDDGSDGTPDPERVQPLLGLDVAGVGTRLRPAAGRGMILPRLTQPRSAPTLTPPGHS